MVESDVLTVTNIRVADHEFGLCMTGWPVREQFGRAPSAPAKLPQSVSA